MRDKKNKPTSKGQKKDQKISMEENQTGKENNEKPEQIASDVSKNKSGRCRVLGVTARILICGLIGSGYHLWNALQQTKTDLIEVVNNEHTQSSLLAGNLAAMDNAIKQLEQKQIEQLEAMTSLYQDKRDSNEDWALAEVEYLLIIAMHRLILEKDVMTALAAMEAADLRLKDLGNPGLLPVRQQLATDMNQLRSVNLADIAGMAIYLSDLIDLSADLPLKSNVLIVETKRPSSSEENPSDNEEPLWKRLPRLLWQEIKSLVVIKRSGEAKQALLLPGEEYFLYQNLRLELENARQSVLRSNSENLRVSIDLIQSWMRQYFDTSDSSVVNVMESLDQMRTVELNPDLPDISSSLENLRAYVREAVSEPTTGLGNVDEIQSR